MGLRELATGTGNVHSNAWKNAKSGVMFLAPVVSYGVLTVPQLKSVTPYVSRYLCVLH
jgi:hypothetical protein